MAVIVIGFVTAAVQVAVTPKAGEDERWTDGSLTVQLEFSGMGSILDGQPGMVESPKKAVKVWLLPGAAAA